MSRALDFLGKAHRKKVIAKAAKAISEITGLDDEKAVNLVVSIVAGSVPAVNLKF